jgi:hypothetical protein
MNNKQLLGMPKTSTIDMANKIPNQDNKELMTRIIKTWSIKNDERDMNSTR